MAEVHHRKIELQEQEDLRYLYSNVLQRANEKINLALPPIEGEDVLRRRVEELVHEYIATTFNTALPNLSINGHAASPALLDLSVTNPAAETYEYEPRDQKQNKRAAALRLQEEALLLELGTLRREAPGKVAEEWRRALGKVEEGKVESGSEVNEGELEVELVVGELDRQRDVEKAWDRGVEGLGRLKKELPGTVARMERAKRAGEYVLAER